MPYISKAEIERRRWFDLAAAIAHIKAVDGCNYRQALQSIRAAIQDRKIPYRLEEQARPPRFSTGPFAWAPASDMLPDKWKVDAHKCLKDTTGRFRVLLLLKSALYGLFEQAPMPEGAAKLGETSIPEEAPNLEEAPKLKETSKLEETGKLEETHKLEETRKLQETPKLEEEIALRQAPELAINNAIEEVYNSAESTGEKPPNLKEIVAPVQATLRNQGFKASSRQIQCLAGADVFKKRRRKRGPTVTSESRRLQKQ
jgi:hypothetical protein